MIRRRDFISIAAAATLPLPGVLMAAPALKIRLGWQKNGVLALAKAHGALETRLAGKGVDIAWSEFSSGPPLLEALGADALDFGPTGDVPPLFAQAAGGNLLYVGAYQGAASGSAILVHQDSSIRSLADLRGRKLAFKRGSSAHNVAVKALRKGGLTTDDVTPVDLPPPDAAAAFKTGAIDAWAIWDPYFAVAEEDPQARVLTTAEGIAESWSFFLGNRGFTESHPDIVREIIDELKKVGVAAQADIDRTVPALSAITGVPEPVTRKVLTRPGFDLGKVYLLPKQAETYQQALADEFHDIGVLPRKLTISDIVWRPKAS
ncbi:sulfonate transport system substrate-binding protein [Rhizobium sp. SG_E_25_P2]|uniref:aliphatic sulfonate ABC transporter substrate-binding protein n=1 Tax=Rhizobium sp. SG_E_25_P2 TaxID=2879942 RepID=UPI002475C45A|nr:aliphatic sulfonate ABC transporter substrate-binding protein [Rhizobium sp. SG_E_25_P2]MDH6264824.1 sulfonate transport system substrate-binding protein [Rhizobium sp. SG_E_25_P2]